MSIIEAAIGWISPPVCLVCGDEGAVLCDACTASEVIPFGAKCWRCGKLSDRARTCPSCRQSFTPRHVWVATDYEGAAKSLLAAYKFGHLRAAAPLLSGLIHQTFLIYNSDEMIDKAKYVVVPVPTASSRRRQRGFGHAELISKNLAKATGAQYCAALGRMGQHRQVGARRADRLQQLQGKYFIKQGRRVRNRNILLVDDVVTTGATLQAATQALRQAGVKHVDALVFAKRL